MTSTYGLGIIGAAIVTTVLWLVTVWMVHPQTGGTMHRILVYTVIGAFILVNGTVVVATLQLGSGPVMAVFGLAMGVQLVAALAGFLFARSHRG